ncbi:MAG: transporter [Pedosphaera sp.]|nr:transporter [Pedosphaera sp.]
MESSKIEIPPVPTKPATSRAPFRFDRNEFAGAFGDIGTDLPLIIGMILAVGLDGASVLIVFGAMQILTGLLYRLPMPVQPLKAVAILVIAQKAGGLITADVVYGGGLAIGVLMLLLTVTGLVDWIGRIVPKSVVRGIQLGLGMQLTTLALKDYVQGDGTRGLWLAGVAFIISLALFGNRKYPAALFVILLGAVYAVVFKLDLHAARQSVGFAWPRFHVPMWRDIVTGFLVLALPQVPLSIGNSLLAARQTAQDLFPDRAPDLRKISLTYSLMNILNPLLSGIPTCHGSGGLAGYYAFGARTGGAVVIYGSLYLVLGAVFSRGFQNVIQVFPLPILGVILLFEGVSMMLLIRDTTGSKLDFFVVLLVGVIANGLPYGYLIALILGTGLAYALPKLRTGLSA